MPAQDTRTALQKIFDFTTQTGIPLAQQLVYGGGRASDSELAQEVNQLDRLNGSGAPDREAFQAAAGRSTYERFFGNPTPATDAGKGAPGINFDVKQLLLLIVVGVIASYIVKKL